MFDPWMRKIPWAGKGRGESERERESERARESWSESIRPSGTECWGQSTVSERHLLNTSGFQMQRLWAGCWEKLRAEGEDGVRGWDGWMASLMQWTSTWQTSGDGEGQGGLACCSRWVCKESYTTGWLNNSGQDKREERSPYTVLISASPSTLSFKVQGMS